MVLFHPGDIRIVSGGPDRRRDFVDRILQQIDPVFGSARGDYEKALRSRNRLLKGDGPDLRSIRAYDDILATTGAVVGRGRKALCSDLAPLVTRAFDDVIGQPLDFSLTYAPRVEPDPTAIADALAHSIDKDRARGFTAEGPHADDVHLQLGEVGAKSHASQGQQRAIVLALKVAELDIVSTRTDRVPVLLLDDVSSELDRVRNRRLFDLLGRLGGQVFLTTTHPEFILIDAQRTDFKVDAGQVQKL